MKNFIKMTLATLTGLLLFGFVVIFIFAGAIGAVASLGNKQPVVPQEGVLTMDMSTIKLTEQTQEIDPISMISGNDKNVQNLGIYSAIRAINTAAEDPAIKFIYMKPDMTSGGMAQIEELRTALENFRKSGKAVVSFIETPTNAGYYLASVSDKIYMSSYEGATNLLVGLSSQMIFLKDLLDKVGINVQLIRHGKYKSAGEMYVRNSASKENMEQNQVMIETLWENMATKIASSRGISVDEFNSIIDGLELNFPEDFMEKGLVDGLVTKEEMKDILTTLSVVEKPEDIETISIQDYAKARTPVNLRPKGKVAVIYADGSIVDGSDVKGIAGDRFAKIISDIRKDSTIKAAVLRVNSPGGSVLASEKIRTEIELLQKRMPVVASYGDYAASGGYWISAGCDKIFTNATTLTGSIGVFSMIPDASVAIKEKLHVNITNVNSNKHSDMYSLTKPLSDAEHAYMQASVERIYGKFTSLVSEGRDMPVERVDEIAQGRVWAGADAIEIKLADQIGTIEDAIAWAAMSIEGVESVADVEVAAYPKPLTSLELLMQNLDGDKQDIVTGKVYARMPYDFIIK